MQNPVLSRKCILTPPEGISWASEMVLNPAIIIDPKTNRTHLLIRTTGPFPEKANRGKTASLPNFSRICVFGRR
ncbi:MAG: hypothetical protein L6V93_13365 [Clostridiales bacterium]|nr:MAG: hypothetical protein L6V93_13365 [Clostridiales bacterium]